MPNHTDAEPRPGKARTIIRHVLGLLAFPAAGLAVALVWLWFTTQILGVGRTGFGNAAAIIVMPLWATGVGLVVWLPFWLVHSRKWGAISASRALLSGAVIGALVSLVFTGPRGFTAQGGATLMAYAVIVFCMLGAAAHNAIAHRRASKAN